MNTWNITQGEAPLQLYMGAKILAWKYRKHDERMDGWSVYLTL